MNFYVFLVGKYPVLWFLAKTVRKESKNITFIISCYTVDRVFF